VHIGTRVRAPFHGRTVRGWVVDEDVGTPVGVDVLPLKSWLGWGPPSALVELAEWAAWRWAGPVSSFLGTASPPRVVRATGQGHRGHRVGASTAAGVGPETRVASPGGGSVAMVDDVLAAGDGPAVVRLAPALDATLVVNELLHRLGPEDVLILAPSHFRATQLAGRLRRTGVPVALLPDQWEQAWRGGRVVIGTRAAAWAPIAHLRAALVLDAHDEAYREERSPTWSAVDVVIERGRRQRSPVVLVTPCPPVAMTEGRTVVTTSRAVERRGWPVVEVVDRTVDDPRTGLFSERLARVLHSVLDRPEGRAVCILNRTGRTRLLACAQCGALARCTRCGGAVAQPEAGGHLQCRRCDETRPPVCAVCDSTRLKTLRIGVTRATEELSALTGVEAVEISATSDRADGGGARLVVGTEAALHRVRRADVVAFLDIDQHLMAPRFGAGEETLALLARASRLVGTRDAGGRVLVQTRIPGHEVLSAAVHADPTLLALPERELRHTLGLPPFGVVASLSGAGAAGFAEGLAQLDTVEVSSTDGDRWMVRAPDHRRLCDALAAVPRPPGRLRVAVDPSDV